MDSLGYHSRDALNRGRNSSLPLLPQTFPGSQYITNLISDAQSQINNVYNTAVNGLAQKLNIPTGTASQLLNGTGAPVSSIDGSIIGSGLINASRIPFLGGAWYLNTDTTYTQNVWSAIGMTLSIVANTALHSTSINTSRFIADRAGKWLILANLTTNTETSYFTSTKNTATPTGGTNNLFYNRTAGVTGNVVTHTFTGLYDLVANDYVQLWYQPTSSTARTLYGSNTGTGSSLCPTTIIWLYLGG